MKYHFRLLDDVCNVNDFKEVDELSIRAGEAADIYLELKTVDSDGEEIRYMPQGTGLVVTVKFRHLDSNKVITRVASQPFADDKSIYKISIAANERLAFDTMEARVQTTTPAFDKVFSNLSILSVFEADGSQFFC